MRPSHCEVAVCGAHRALWDLSLPPPLDNARRIHAADRAQGPPAPLGHRPQLGVLVFSWVQSLPSTTIRTDRDLVAGANIGKRQDRSVTRLPIPIRARSPRSLGLG